MEDEDLAADLASMREFLEEEEEEEEDGGEEKASWETKEVPWDAQTEFAAAAELGVPADTTTTTTTEEAQHFLLRRGGFDLDESDLEHVRRELENLEDAPEAEAPEDALPRGRISELDDIANSAGFLHKGSGKPTKTAASAGLYEAAAAAEDVLTPRKKDVYEDEGTPLTYKEFLARLMLPHSHELVAHVKAFVVRALDEARSLDDGVRARKPGARERRDQVLRRLPERCGKFFDAAEAHLERHPEWKKIGRIGIASSRAALEKYVMNKIGAFAFESCRDDETDDRLRARCRALASFLTPDHLDIKPGLCNEVVLHIARDELRRMDSCRAPADKVDCVVKCASIIFSALNLSRAETSSKRGGGVANESRAGADDFLPVFIYVVLHADAPRLYSNCDYVQAYHNPAQLMSKAGYCFVNLRSAVEFLLNLSHDQIGMDQNDFNAKLQRALDDQNHHQQQQQQQKAGIGVAEGLSSSSSSSSS